MWDLSIFSSIIGLAVYSYSNITMSFTIKEMMENPKDMQPLFNSVTVGMTVFFIIFGVFSSLALGEKVKEYVLLSFPNSSLTEIWISNIINGFYALGLILTFPLKFFPIVKTLEAYDWAKQLIE